MLTFQYERPSLSVTSLESPSVILAEMNVAGAGNFVGTSSLTPQTVSFEVLEVGDRVVIQLSRAPIVEQWLVRTATHKPRGQLLRKTVYHNSTGRKSHQEGGL